MHVSSVKMEGSRAMDAVEYARGAPVDRRGTLRKRVVGRDWNGQAYSPFTAPPSRNEEFTAAEREQKPKDAAT